jgi:hypothetical protein
MKPFCEVIVSDVMPAMRALVAKELMKKGLKQSEVSNLLGITQPAVSQYLGELRGYNVKMLQSNKKIMGMIRSVAEDIASKKFDSKKIHQKLCQICIKVRKEGMVCSLHASEYTSLKSSSCGMCKK